MDVEMSNRCTREEEEEEDTPKSFRTCSRLLYILGLIAFCAGAAMLLFSFQKPTATVGNNIHLKLRSFSPFVVSLGIGMVAFGKALSLSEGRLRCGRDSTRGTANGRRRQRRRATRARNFARGFPGNETMDQSLMAHFDKPPPPPYSLHPPDVPHTTSPTAEETTPLRTTSQQDSSLHNKQSSDGHEPTVVTNLTFTGNCEAAPPGIIGEPPPPYPGTPTIPRD